MGLTFRFIGFESRNWTYDPLFNRQMLYAELFQIVKLTMKCSPVVSYLVRYKMPHSICLSPDEVTPPYFRSTATSVPPTFVLPTALVCLQTQTNQLLLNLPSSFIGINWNSAPPVSFRWPKFPTLLWACKPTFFPIVNFWISSGPWGTRTPLCITGEIEACLIGPNKLGGIL